MTARTRSAIADKLSSRKLLIAVFVIALALANKWAGLGLDQETLSRVVMAAAAYIIGEGLADMAKK